MQTRIVPPSGGWVGPDRNHRIHNAPPHLRLQRRGSTSKRCPVGTQEGKRAVRVAGNTPSTLVHQSVVKRAQQHQIVEISASTLGPMHEVVGMDPAGPLASGETTALVSVPNLAAQPGRNPSCGAPDSRPCDLGGNLHPGVTGQAPGGLSI